MLYDLFEARHSIVGLGYWQNVGHEVGVGSPRWHRSHVQFMAIKATVTKVGFGPHRWHRL